MVDTVEILKGRTLNEDEYLKAAILGWCVELVSVSYPSLPHRLHLRLMYASRRRIELTHSYKRTSSSLVCPPN